MDTVCQRHQQAAPVPPHLSEAPRPHSSPGVASQPAPLRSLPAIRWRWQRRRHAAVSDCLQPIQPAVCRKAVPPGLPQKLSHLRALLAGYPPPASRKEMHGALTLRAGRVGGADPPPRAGWMARKQPPALYPCKGRKGSSLRVTGSESNAAQGLQADHTNFEQHA